MNADNLGAAGPLLRVLVLEDEPMIAAMLIEWLTELQCDPVGPATSTDAALAIIAAEALDCAILDVSLKGGDSFPAAEALQAKNVPFAFATGREPDDLTSRFAGAVVLLKPFDFSAVSALIGQWSR
ncbi:MAG: response regulator [Caulobacterales bacterium]